MSREHGLGNKSMFSGVLLLALLFSLGCEGFTVRCTATRNSAALRSTPGGEDFITSIFKRFLPTPEDVGLTQFTKDTLPEKFPATTTELASLLPSDNDENKRLIRPTLAQTNLERRPLVLAFDAKKDGWTAKAFHAKLDRKGPSVVLCRTVDGAVFGGYNPCGWVNLGESRGCIAAFLFYFPLGDTKQRAVKLQKIGGAGMAQVDDGGGPRFGMEGLVSSALVFWLVRLG